MPNFLELSSPLRLAREALETRLGAIYETLTGDSTLIDWRYRSTALEVFETVARGNVHLMLSEHEPDGNTGVRVYEVYFRLMFASHDIGLLCQLLDNHRYWFMNHVFKQLKDGVAITWDNKTYQVLENMKFIREVSVLDESPDGGGIETCLWVAEWLDSANLLEGGFMNLDYWV